MIMNARNLAAYLEPLLDPAFDHIQSIRLGTKSISYWPYRYLTDRDADDVLRLFEKVVNAGKHLAVMAHVNHWRELSTPASLKAIRRIRSTGAEIRTQSPLIRHINDDPVVWSRMWKEQVRAGCIPYYMFIERDTGSKRYFSVPLVRAWEIFQSAYQRVSGLARTVRGPSMSAYPGKIAVEGVADVQGEKVFVLSMLQSRYADNVKRPFFARFDPKATWLTDLKPAFGHTHFFFEQENWKKDDGIPPASFTHSERMLQ
jgi:L-lysine 2,3-aminomutase